MSLPESVLEGKYEVVRQISEGGMGAVYLVRHLHLEQDQVIKVIRPQHAANEDLQKRFRREAQIAIRLRHPKIAEIYDFSIGSDGTAYLVMEFIDGRTLENLILKGERMALGLTLEIAVQTLEALEFLHHRGYIHRDISPDNVMLTRDFDGEPLVKLIDLGIAKRIGDDASRALTQAGMFVGKARYSSPEHCGRGELSPLSDLYSFGVVLYELLTGTSPIPGTTVPELIGAHLLKPPLAFSETDPDGRVPEALRAIVMRALEKEANRRMASARDFITLLEPLRLGISPAQTIADLENTLRLPVDALLGPAREVDPDRVSAALSSARLLVGQSLFDEARTELLHVLNMDPRNSEAMRILSMVEELLRHRAEAQRQGEITRQAEKIEELLTRGELALAGDELADAVAEYGEAELFHQLHLRLERALAEERERQMRQQALALLAKAERYLEGDDLPATQRNLQKARDLAVRDTEVERRLAGVEEAAQRAAAQRARIEEERRLATAKRQAFEQRLSAARRQHAEGALERAGEELREALTLEPGNGQAELFLAEVESALKRQRQEEARRREVDGEVQRIGKLISEERLDEAAAALSEAMRTLAATAAWHQLREDLETAQRRQLEAKIAELTDRARRHYRATELETALQAAQQAHELDPARPQARKLLEKIEAACRGDAERQARVRAAREILARIEAALAAGDLAAAAEMLRAAEQDLGAGEATGDLASRLEELRAEHRQVRIAQLLTNARQFLEAQVLGQASEEVQAALALAPSHREARQLMREVEAAQQQDAERQAWEAERREVVTQIEKQLSEGQLEAAARALAAAEKELGAGDDFSRLTDDLQRRERTARLSSLLDSGRRHLRAGELDESMQRVEEALAVDPEHLAAGALRAEIETERRERRIASKAGRLDACLEQGDLLKAGELLAKAERDYGAHDGFRALRERLELLLAQERAEQVAAENAQRVRGLCKEVRTAALKEDFDAARAGIREALELDPNNPQVASLRDLVEEAIRRAGELARERAIAATAAEAEDLLARGKLARAGKRLEAAIEQYGEVPEFQQLHERHEQACQEEEKRRAERRKKVLAKVPWAVAAVLAVAIGLTVGWWLSTRPTPGPPAATGTAIVNAVPWGRLVEVVDEAGNPHPAAPRGAYTPVSIALPPGKYVARLENAHFKEPVSIEIEVVAGQPARSLARFDEVSVDAFLHDLGW